MTSEQARRAVVASAVGSMAALAASAVAVAVAFEDFGAVAGASSTWYLRARALDFSVEVLVMGALGYAMPRNQVTAAAMRLAVVLAVFGIASEITEWVTEHSTPFAASSGGAGSRIVDHVSELFVYAAAIYGWVVRDRLKPVALDLA